MLQKLYGYLAKYEQEKLFIEAKISVVKDMIADEETNSTQEVVEQNDEVCVEEQVADESI